MVGILDASDGDIVAGLSLQGDDIKLNIVLDELIDGIDGIAIRLDTIRDKDKLVDGIFGKLIIGEVEGVLEIRRGSIEATLVLHFFLNQIGTDATGSRRGKNLGILGKLDDTNLDGLVILVADVLDCLIELFGIAGFTVGNVDKDIHLDILARLQDLHVGKGEGQGDSHHKMNGKGDDVLGSEAFLFRDNEESRYYQYHQWDGDKKQIGVFKFNTVHVYITPNPIRIRHLRQ